MLVTDIIGSRLLYSASPRTYYKAHIVLQVKGEAVLPPYTGKVVKTLLISAEPGLEDVFSANYNPKPIAISTLAKRVNNKYLYLWKKSGSDVVLKVDPGDIVEFWTGFTEDIASKMVEALTGLDGLELFNTKWSLLEYNIESYKLPAKPEEVPLDYRLDDAVAVKVEFRTPALLLDPYKKTIYKRFLPTPGNVFSYNIGDLLRLTRDKEYIEVVILVNALLNETYTVLKTVKPVKYVYGKKSLPGIVGYAKYMIDWDLLVETKAKHLLENLLLHASIMGIGTSRANGFGHVTIKVIQSNE
ncbi:CRISPR system precrRNA processing endoribonuclease RAMP protein Cas6 [Staphylothermus hellenicus]|uniref:CRISPR-associated protein Cas6 C-terminal domain-containing protein n=1 Tax=Staphylothermus hellenicus (strain DSM 12710 / JCM 10830 / BK20S6-10-b1 / P8) TaxID=591019 RepID=D7DBR0_STAHD|nr:CRISPR system precrRNA processing endoribonuclease RAMP protein Cas6 [Staphylothermus hellenicus]ADI31607.1 hypothetical protein Shell_0476 [Staphylothermus hellenicus DSM 12710]